jgi:hypothetical protein
MIAVKGIHESKTLRIKSPADESRAGSPRYGDVICDRAVMVPEMTHEKPSRASRPVLAAPAGMSRDHRQASA